MPETSSAHPPASTANVRVLRRDRLGGLIHEYFQVAYGDAISGTHTLLIDGYALPVTVRLHGEHGGWAWNSRRCRDSCSALMAR